MFGDKLIFSFGDYRLIKICNHRYDDNRYVWIVGAWHNTCLDCGTSMAFLTNKCPGSKCKCKSCNECYKGCGCPAHEYDGYLKKRK